MYLVWILVGLLVVGGAVTVSRSRNKELPPAPQKPQIESAPEAEAEQPEGESEPEPDALAGPQSAGEPEPVESETEAVASTLEQAPAPEKELDQPESAPSRMHRLRSRLAGSGRIGSAVLGILSRQDLSEEDWEELEDTLLMADLGLDTTDQIMQGLRQKVKVEDTSDPERVRSLLRDELLAAVDPSMDRSLNLAPAQTETGMHPAVVLVVGVNGTGKTTTVGKLARLLVAEDKSVLLGAADTFRAAAAEQLTTWGERVGVKTVRSELEGADPSSVAFDAIKTGREDAVDVVLVDTAGRLQNKSTLMDELGKVKRVMEKQGPIAETLLVLDATTGQNGLRQAEIFAQVVDVSGVVLTKLDGSAKGGIVVSVQKALGVPVKLVGLGEGADDLAPFSPGDFVDAIVG